MSFKDLSDLMDVCYVLCNNFFVTIRDAVRDFLHEIYFLPDLPELKEIQVVLQEYRKVQLLLAICLFLMHQMNS